MACLVLHDPARDILLESFTQPIPLPAHYIEKLRASNPLNYAMSDSGFATRWPVLLGQEMPGADPHDPHRILAGVSRYRLMESAASALARSYELQLQRWTSPLATAESVPQNQPPPPPMASQDSVYGHGSRSAPPMSQPTGPQSSFSPPPGPSAVLTAPPPDTNVAHQQLSGGPLFQANTGAGSQVCWQYSFLRLADVTALAGAIAYRTLMHVCVSVCLSVCLSICSALHEPCRAKRWLSVLLKNRENGALNLSP